MSGDYIALIVILGVVAFALLANPRPPVVVIWKVVGLKRMAREMKKLQEAVDKFSVAVEAHMEALKKAPPNERV